jgi:hypothetical protein
MSLVLTPYGIFGSSASEKFPCKPVKDSISSNCVGERVGKSPVAELLEDVIGAHALRHHRKLRLRKISLQARDFFFDLVIQFQTLSYLKFYQILKYAKIILINIVLIENGKIVNSLDS